MDTREWTTRLKKLPHRILDHPLSGAYAAWVGMANVAVSSPDSNFRLASLGATGALGLALTIGRKYMIRSDIVKKTKQRIRVATKKNYSDLSKDSLVDAFNTLYALGGITATRGLARTLPALTTATTAKTPWGADAVPITEQSRTWLTEQMVKGSLYFAMQEPPLLTGKLPKTLQKYIVSHYPEWLAEYPHHFTPALAERERPGLFDVALSLNALHFDQNDKRLALRSWLDSHEVGSYPQDTPGVNNI